MSENIQVPNGWEVKKLGECFKHFGGTALEKYIDNTSEFKFISIGNYSTQGKYLDNGKRIILNDITKTKLLCKDDLVMVLNDKTADGKIIGATILIDEDNTYIYNQRSERLVCNKNVLPLYFWFFLNSELIRKKVFSMAQGGTQIYINFSSVTSINILLPPLEEQKKIAEILMLWDKAIEQTKELITYKEKQKKGLMQLLLTGKKRLDGFTDEWKTVKLGECFKNFGGAPLEKYMDNTGEYKFISIGNYSTNGKYIDNGNRIILNDITQTKLLNKNDLVMVLNDKTADGKIIGATILIDEDNTYIYNQRSERIVCNKNIFPLFFWFLLNSKLIRKEIFAMAQGGTQIYINFSSIKSINILQPTLNEQKAIAEVLSKADEEIELLNKQLELYTEQKKGLMQNLLTGKIRV